MSTEQSPERTAAQSICRAYMFYLLKAGLDLDRFVLDVEDIIRDATQDQSRRCVMSFLTVHQIHRIIIKLREDYMRSHPEEPNRLMIPESVWKRYAEFIVPQLCMPATAVDVTGQAETVFMGLRVVYGREIKVYRVEPYEYQQEHYSGPWPELYKKGVANLTGKVIPL